MTVTTRNGFTFQIDPEDWERLKHFSWYGQRDHRTSYILRGSSNARGTAIRMHREILGALPGTVVDHLDGDGLNNQKSNLRGCSPLENSQNTRKRSNNRYGFKGVRPAASYSNPFEARIRVAGRQLHLGVFPTAEAAAKAYDAAALKYHGEFARLNFPTESNPHAA